MDKKDGYSIKKSDTRIDHYRQNDSYDGYSEKHGDVWYNYDESGRYTGESKSTHDWLGDKIMVNRTADGAFDGTSKDYKGPWGSGTVHRDKSGRVTGKTEYSGSHRRSEYYSSSSGSSYSGGSSGSSDSSAVGGIIGMALGAVLIFFLVVWIALVSILLFIIDLALIFFIVARAEKSKSQYFYALSVLAAIFLVFDYNRHLFTASFAHTLDIFKALLPWLYYINLTAGFLSAYFFTRDYFNKTLPQDENDGEFTRVNMTIMACILLLAVFTVGSQKYADAKMAKRNEESAARAANFVMDTTATSTNGYVTSVLKQTAPPNTVDTQNMQLVLAQHKSATLINFFNEDKIEYPLPQQGTVLLWLYVSTGEGYKDYTLLNDSANATVYTNTGPDGWFAGSEWLEVSRNGDITLYTGITSGLHTRQELKATHTGFKFNEWHQVGFSYGDKGQYIYVDGRVVASASGYTQLLVNNDCNKSSFGYFKSCYWGNKQYDGGFNGAIDQLKVSAEQQDWKERN